MKKLVGLSQIIVLGVFFFLAISTVKAGAANPTSASGLALVNVISGQIFDPYRNPVSNINVELINANFSTVSRQRITNGRFMFSGIAPGSYKVKVLTLGTNFLEQEEDVQLLAMLRNGSDQVFIEIYLKFDPRKVTLGSGGVPEEVFAQEIPQQARKHYQKGLEQLADKKDKGLTELEKAIQIFPNYFDALNRLGTEYVQRKEYLKAFPHLIKAIDINQRSFSSFYALGYAAYRINHLPEAMEATRAATIIKPDSIMAHWLYGTILRINGSYAKAEKELLQAKSLNKDKPFPEIHWQLALLYNKLGRNKEAAVELEAYLKTQPNLTNKKEIQDLVGKLKTQTE